MLFEYATYVDAWHPDGDWYEYETISCIICAHIRYEHTIHCSEYSGFNDHYDGVKREVGLYDEQGHWKHVDFDGEYDSPVPDSKGFSISSYRPWWGRHEDTRRESTEPDESKGDDADTNKSNLISAAEEARLSPSLNAVYAEISEQIARGKVHLYELSPRKFEEFIAALFENHGYKVELTQTTRDGGYDVIAIGRNPLGLDLRIIVECKRNRPDRPVELSVARALWGVLTDPANQFDRGIIATTSRVSRDTKRLIESSLWRLGILEHEQIMNFAGFEREGQLWVPGPANRKFIEPGVR
jgi:restriction system protein